MVTQAEKAETFRALHEASVPFALPNAWDVPSARVFEDAGFPAVATSSAGIMVSLGFPDGEAIPRKEYLAAVRRIVERLSVPVTADVVSGFGRGARAVVRTVELALETGAVGINLEDLTPSGDGLLPLRGQLGKIRAVRELGRTAGIPLVVNARTDALRHAPGEPGAKLKEAIRRAKAYREAGADCVYPMGLVAAEEIATFVDAVRCPVNVMVRRGLPPMSELERLGVRRVSFGPGASYAALGLLRRIGEEVRTQGTFQLLTEGAISFDELNALAVARRPPAAPGP